ncbi:MAG: hypothetical protein JNL32_12540 [Candidatus Kapabacteria bacterium]|nr:hypothetical protein [Candidatus Kapabacteria bacterium]
MTHTTLNHGVLNTPISGVNLKAATLGEELGATPTLLVFLRHFGCIFCREMVKDIRNASATNTGYPPVVFFYQGTVEQGRDFFNDLWSDARAISDSPLTFYKGFGIERGSVAEMLSPGVWACSIRAAVKGNFIGLPVGDPWVMPGLFFVENGNILWQHDFAHAGDHPDFSRLPELIMHTA